MGTDIQEIYDSFFVKVPSVDFANQEALIFQLFKSALSYCYRTVPESLIYDYDIEIHEGTFHDTLAQDTIELISLNMKRELYRRNNDKFNAIKQHIGTQSFNKLPNMIDQSKETRMIYESLNDEIERFRQEFYHLDDD